MAITVTLYHCGADNRVLDKTGYLDEGFEVEGVFRDSAELHNPVFTVQGTIPASYNYAKIEVEKDGTSEIRWYYINVENTRTNLSTIYADVDVLMTYLDSILLIPVVCKRSAINWGAKYVFDRFAPIETRKNVSDTPDRLRNEMAYLSDDMVLVTVG